MSNLGEINSATQVDLTADVTWALPVANGWSWGTTSTGTWANVLATSPALVTPALGTPASWVMTNMTWLPVAWLANGTDWELITWSATWVATTVAVWTVAQVLTSNWVWVAPTFQPAAAGGSLTVYVPWNSLDQSSANAISDNYSNGAWVLNYTDNLIGLGATTAIVPAWATSISSIKVSYVNETATAVVRVRFQFTKLRVWIAFLTDEQSTFSHTTWSTITRREDITVASTWYDGLGTLEEWDFIWMNIARFWSDASDTYWKNWLVLWVEFTFA